MLYVAYWTIPAEKTADAIIVHEALRSGELGGLKTTLYMIADTRGNAWQGISLVEADSAETLARLLLRLNGIGEVRLKPAIAEEDALRIWHEQEEKSSY